MPSEFFILWDEFSVEKLVILGDFWPTDVNYDWIAKPSRNLRLISTEPDDMAQSFRILRKCKNKFNCLIFEMFFIKDLNQR